MIRERVINTKIPWAPAESSAENVRALDEMLSMYSPFGAIRNVLTTFRSGIGPGGFQGTATPMSLDHALRRMLGMSALAAGLDRDIYGGGKGLALSDSVASSLGEAVERMLGAYSCLSDLSSDQRITATAAELATRGESFVGPEDFQAFTPEQLASPGFRCVPWQDDTSLVWHRGINLVDGAPYWVPAQFIHLLYISSPNEARVGASSSGGLATHIDDDSALIHGLLEVVERDHLNVAWFSKVPLTKVVLDSPFRDPAIQEWLESAERVGLQVEFFLHRLDIPDVFVITAAGVESGLDSGCYVSGGGVGLSIDEAIRSALAEVVQAERMVRSPQVAPGWELTAGFERRFGIQRDALSDRFNNFIQVVAYYGYAENQQKLDWFFRDPNMPTMKLSQLQAESIHMPTLPQVVEVFAKHGMTPIAFDFTPADFRQVRTRKVFVPELAPAFPPNLPQLGHARYRTIRRKLGLDDRDWTYADMPSDPLPYP